MLLLQMMIKIAQEKNSSEGNKGEKTERFILRAFEYHNLNLCIISFEGTRKRRPSVERHHGHERLLKQRAALQKLTDR